MAVTAEELRAQAAAYAEQGRPREGPLERVFHSAQRLIHGYALLAVLDLRRAAVQMVWLIACGLMIGVLLVTAWLGMLTALVTWLLGQHLPLPIVLLMGAALNVVAAAVLGWRVKGLVTEVPFGATLRQLKGDPPEASS